MKRPSRQKDDASSLGSNTQQPPPEPLRASVQRRNRGYLLTSGEQSSLAAHGGRSTAASSRCVHPAWARTTRGPDICERCRHIGHLAAVASVGAGGDGGRSAISKARGREGGDKQSDVKRRLMQRAQVGQLKPHRLPPCAPSLASNKDDQCRRRCEQCIRSVHP